MELTEYHAKYFAYLLTRQATGGLERLSMALFDASVDLNPHQIEAALFALRSPLAQGVILADEVGLGKTIEAGIVLCQYWAERKRKLLVLCPAAIRKQWALELEDKFNLPAKVIDKSAIREARRRGEPLFAEGAINILSFHFASALCDELRDVAWDLVIIDEAHKLRNAYRPSNRIGQRVRQATGDSRKLLLTATPLQNSLMELYGLTYMIDEHLFGDPGSFRTRYANTGGDLPGLRARLAEFCQRTLRSQVAEFVRYTERHALTIPFTPTDAEHQLYEDISAFLQRPVGFAIPDQQRHLLTMTLRKLLASSPQAIAATLEVLHRRLVTLRSAPPPGQLPTPAASPSAADDLVDRLLEDLDIGDAVIEDYLDADDPEALPATPAPMDRRLLEDEIATLERLIARARHQHTDSKLNALDQALTIGFDHMATMPSGPPRKALIFTESRETQELLRAHLESHGYAGQVLVFNGQNGGPHARAIYEDWLRHNRDSDRIAGSREVNLRTALVEHFRDHATIMIATEAGAEGLNLQFCSLVINYDLPWNPQRIEQRIGRCHRYGQKHDVVVINFVNQRNHADERVLELLTEKFTLFEGIFGASDEILGSIESGVDIEKRILAIYQTCRTQDAIEAAFQALRTELDTQIRERLTSTRKMLFEHFDEEVHQRLRFSRSDAQAHLDQFGQRFWQLTEYLLAPWAQFDARHLAFDLHQAPRPDLPTGRYHLITKNQPTPATPAPASEGHLYRLSHPLGQFVIESAKRLAVPPVRVIFEPARHEARLHLVEARRGQSGYLLLTRLELESCQREDFLLFTGCDEQGADLDPETLEKFFACPATLAPGALALPAARHQQLLENAKRQVHATLTRAAERDNQQYRQACDRLDRWLEDKVLAAEREIRDQRDRLKVLKRDARQAETVAHQLELQEQVRQQETQLRRLRQQLFAREDELSTQHGELMGKLQQRLAQQSQTETLFTIAWTVR